MRYGRASAAPTAEPGIWLTEYCCTSFSIAPAIPRPWPWVQMALGEARARFEALKVMNWKMAWEITQGRLEPAHASAAKVYGSETMIEICRLIQEVLGVAGTLQRGSSGAALEGRIELTWRGCQINTYGGGVNEVQREIISMLGLGLPRAPR